MVRADSTGSSTSIGFRRLALAVFLQQSRQGFAGFHATAAGAGLLANCGANASRDRGNLIYVRARVRHAHAGLDAVLGLAFTRTGWVYPFFGTFLGWLGVALTRSDTSSNALFGSLQRITSQPLGIDPVLMCAANSAGGAMGKMVDAQSITIATAASEQGCHRLSVIPLFRFLEVKQDGNEIEPSKFIAHCVQHALPVGREAAKNQYNLGRNRVDNPSDLLVVQQPVDELRTSVWSTCDGSHLRPT